MPELPEVETVRRGLQPVMEGSKIISAEARRKDLRFPFQKDFVARLAGQTVKGLGRRAKYLMVDLGSGDRASGEELQDHDCALAFVHTGGMDDLTTGQARLASLDAMLGNLSIALTSGPSHSID